MSVRCKMRVTQINETTYAGSIDGSHTQKSVELQAVMGDANKTWSKYTPSGSVKLAITNPAAVEQFKIGEFYFVDFTPAPATEAEEAK